MPQNNMEAPPRVETTDPVNREEPGLCLLIPDNPNQPYDIKQVIAATVDDGQFLEVQPDFAPNLVIAFGRYGGQSVGIVANQPQHLAGVLDNDASVKGARFVRFCDAFNIPLVTFVDVPGFLPGTNQEYGGIIRNGAKLLYAYAEATVPKVTITNPQGLWRCVLRDEFQTPARRYQLCLAVGGNRRHGSQRRCRDPLCQGSQGQPGASHGDPRRP